MIQRIQHLYLLCSLLANIGFFFTPLFVRLLEDPSSWISAGIFSGLAISGVLAFASIFMFTNRPKQRLYVKRALLFQVLGIAVSFGLFFIPASPSTWIGFLPLGLPLCALLFMILAIRCIQKDEELVKSIDRIR